MPIAFERAQLLGLRAGARKEISALDRATSRLRAGAYGHCVNCGYVIPDARLEALPAAETCLIAPPGHAVGVDVGLSDRCNTEPPRLNTPTDAGSAAPLLAILHSTDGAASDQVGAGGE